MAGPGKIYKDCMHSRANLLAHKRTSHCAVSRLHMHGYIRLTATIWSILSGHFSHTVRITQHSSTGDILHESITNEPSIQSCYVIM